MKIENYFDSQVAPTVQPNYPTNAPKPDCPLGIIFGKVGETLRKICYGLDSHQIDPRKLNVTQPLTQMFDSVDDICESYKKFEFCRQNIEREVGGYGDGNQPAVSVTNNSSRIFGSFEELRKSTE